MSMGGYGDGASDGRGKRKFTWPDLDRFKRTDGSLPTLGDWIHQWIKGDKYGGYTGDLGNVSWAFGKELFEKAWKEPDDPMHHDLRQRFERDGVRFNEDGSADWALHRVKDWPKPGAMTAAEAFQFERDLEASRRDEALRDRQRDERRRPADGSLASSTPAAPAEPPPQNPSPGGAQVLLGTFGKMIENGVIRPMTPAELRRYPMHAQALEEQKARRPSAGPRAGGVMGGVADSVAALASGRIRTASMGRHDADLEGGLGGHALRPEEQQATLPPAVARNAAGILSRITKGVPPFEIADELGVPVAVMGAMMQHFARGGAPETCPVPKELWEKLSTSGAEADAPPPLTIPRSQQSQSSERAQDSGASHPAGNPRSSSAPSGGELAGNGAEREADPDAAKPIIAESHPGNKETQALNDHIARTCEEVWAREAPDIARRIIRLAGGLDEKGEKRLSEIGVEVEIVDGKKVYRFPDILWGFDMDNPDWDPLKMAQKGEGVAVNSQTTNKAGDPDERESSSASKLIDLMGDLFGRIRKKWDDADQKQRDIEQMCRDRIPAMRAALDRIEQKLAKAKSSGDEPRD